MNYRELLSKGTATLEAVDIVDAKVDAWYLLSHVTGMRRQDYLLKMQDEVAEEEKQRYEEVIATRAKHIPLQYITGTQEFMGLEFAVNPNVLIPRQDTETLVEQALTYVREDSRVLDMCTGSGCILISLLHMKKGAMGVGVDVSEEALATAKENGARHEVDAQWIHSDLFAGVEGDFDVIVSNPPYIATAVIEELMPEVVEHEPYRALDGHEDGLFFYREICKDAPRFLKTGGTLLYEIGYDQGKAVAELMREAGFVDVSVIKDYAGNDRVVKGCLKEEHNV